MSALTEAAVVQLLRERHTASGNGGAGEHAFLAQVRNAAGFDATRTFDAVAVNLWPSRGLAIHIFEVKVSRSDWKRELAKPDKAEDACKIADRFSIVAPAGCVKDGELPPEWGLIEVTGDGDSKPWKLREKVPAKLLREGSPKARPVSRGLLVGMLRAAPGAVPGGKVQASQPEIDAAYARGKADAETSHERMRPYREREQAQIIAAVKALQEALQAQGIDSWNCTPERLTKHAAVIAKAIKGGDVDQQLARARLTLQGALQALEAAA